MAIDVDICLDQMAQKLGFRHNLYCFVIFFLLTPFFVEGLGLEVDFVSPLSHEPVTK